MNFKQAVAAIDKWTVRAVKPGLSRTRTLLKFCGDPDKFFPVIQIAGTNGKGSVTAMLSSVLSVAGYRTGRFTSPHLIDECERIAINDQQISKQQFVKGAIEIINPLRKMFEMGVPATTFEAWTVLAAIIFKKEKINIAVVETGMGGRFDSTTALSKKILTCLTNIQLDHTDILGHTKKEIAFEKIGITRRGIPLLCAEPDYKIRKEISRLLQKKKVPFHFCGKNRKDHVRVLDSRQLSCGTEVVLQTDKMSTETWQTSLSGSFQESNVALAVMALQWLNGFGWDIDKAAIEKGLSQVKWPGRMEKIADRPLIYLDGGHNPAAVAAVLQSLKPDIKELVIVIGMMKDKDVVKCVNMLAPFTKKAYVFQPDDKARGLEAEQLKKMFDKKKVVAEVGQDVSECLEKCLKQVKKTDKVIIIGSLYNIKSVKKWILRQK